MPDTALSNSAIIAAYRAKTPASAEWAARARESFPSGITHDSRHLAPYALYVDARRGRARKWDADGNEYVDYFGGHGALIAWPQPPDRCWPPCKRRLPMAPTSAPATRARCSGPSRSSRMVPCAERIRFTSSGTEATMMAAAPRPRLHRPRHGYAALPHALPWLERSHGQRSGCPYGRHADARRCLRHHRGNSAGGSER